MQNEYGHYYAAWMDMVMQNGHGHAAWVLTRQNGHGQRMQHRQKHTYSIGHRHVDWTWIWT
jgi:hypothetical protein